MEEHAVVNNQIQQPPVNPDVSKPNHWLIAIIVLVSLIVIGMIYVNNLRLQKQMVPPPPEPPLPPKITLQPSPSDETANWDTYRNDELRYEFKYPPDPLQPQRTMGDDSFTIGYGLKGETFAKSIDTYWIWPEYISQSQLNVMGVTYCGANPKDSSRCESKIIGGTTATIDWQIPVGYNDYTSGKQEKKIQIKASVWVPHPEGGVVTLQLQPVVPESKEIFSQIFSTFKFTNPEDQVACTLDAKLCSDGSYVSRQPPNCEFAACP